MDKQNKNIYEMELHDQIKCKDHFIDVLRVAGGWIYSYYNYEDNMAVFVPFSDEFKEKK